MKAIAVSSGIGACPARRCLAPGQARRRRNGRGMPLLRGSTAGAMRRVWRANSSYSSCHSRRAVRGQDLHRRHLVFRAIGRPIRILGRDHVGLRVG